MKTQNSNLAIPIDVPAIPENPRSAAINAITKNVKAHESMFISLFPGPISSNTVAFSIERFSYGTVKIM